MGKFDKYLEMAGGHINTKLQHELKTLSHEDLAKIMHKFFPERFRGSKAAETDMLYDYTNAQLIKEIMGISKEHKHELYNALIEYIRHLMKS